MNIGDASRATGVSERMIRHYETIGLVPLAARRQSGYRDYDHKDVHRLRFVANARDLGFPIEDIRSLLALWADPTRASAEVKRVALARAAELHRKAQALEAMRQALMALVDGCNGDVRPDCPIISALANQPGRSLRQLDMSRVPPDRNVGGG
jgi:MerR family transcriptional regulator, copper efflux regulator